jgi:hypothetical protein
MWHTSIDSQSQRPAHPQHTAHRRRAIDQLVELWQLEHRELAQPLMLGLRM